jgi:hypothetical protein
VTFRYLGKEVNYVTKLFKKAKLGVVHTTKNNTVKILNTNTKLIRKQNFKTAVITSSHDQNVTTNIWDRQTGSFQQDLKSMFWHVEIIIVIILNLYSMLDNGHTLRPIDQCFPTAGPQPGNRPWHQLYQTARDLSKIKYVTRFH